MSAGAPDAYLTAGYWMDERKQKASEKDEDEEKKKRKTTERVKALAQKKMLDNSWAAPRTAKKHRTASVTGVASSSRMDREMSNVQEENEYWKISDL